MYFYIFEKTSLFFMKEIDYGIDAPKVIRNLLIIGIALLFIGIKLLIYPFEYLHPMGSACITTSISLILSAALMFRYARYGKFKHRDRMLALYDWRGNENVLDVGSGLGLMLIGAAKKLTTGKATGIDIWNAKDLSNNTRDHAIQNIEYEKVSDKAKILNENIMQTTFKDKSFDVILSNLCIHNISDKAGREKACKEIFRLLTDNGVAIISDFKHTKEYTDVFNSLGMSTEKIGTYYSDTFPPLTIIRSRKK
jgi:arsenite methyltransferase